MEQYGPFFLLTGNEYSPLNCDRMRSQLLIYQLIIVINFMKTQIKQYSPLFLLTGNEYSPLNCDRMRSQLLIYQLIIVINFMKT